MPRIYVAFKQDGTRIASGSATEIREKIRKYTDTQWAIYKYEFKAGVDTFVLLIENDVSKWGQPELVEWVRINAEGQSRKFDPTKQSQAAGSA